MMVIAPKMSPWAIISGVYLEWDPPDFGRLVRVRLSDKLGPARQVQVLWVVGVADERLARHYELEAVWVPACFFLHLAGRRGAGVFAVVHVAARQLPQPAAAHPEDVLREAHVIRKLDVGQAHEDVRGLVQQLLAVDRPLVRVSHGGDASGPQRGTGAGACAQCLSRIPHAYT